MDHVTLEFAVFESVAVKGCVWLSVTVAAAGEMLTATGGFSVTVAVVDFVGSATLVAVTVTACTAVVFAGAVYRPVAEMVPSAGLTDHVTFVLLFHATFAMNCCVAEGRRVAVDGDMMTLVGGFRRTVPLVDLVGSATLVAVNVIACCDEMALGAV